MRGGRHERTPADPAEPLAAVALAGLQGIHTQKRDVVVPGIVT